MRGLALRICYQLGNSITLATSAQNGMVLGDAFSFQILNCCIQSKRLTLQGLNAHAGITSRSYSDPKALTCHELQSPCQLISPDPVIQS